MDDLDNISLSICNADSLAGIVNHCAERGWVAQGWEWRGNHYNNSLNGDGKIEVWHQDGVANNKWPTKYMILWSSCESTLIQKPNGEIFRPANFEIIVVNNLTCKHKKRENIGLNRLFARGSCAQKIIWNPDLNVTL